MHLRSLLLLLPLWLPLLQADRATAVAPHEVLLVFNSQGVGYHNSILDAYHSAHPGTPGVDAPYELDLNDPDIPAADVSYAEFVAHIRNPIRSKIEQLAPGHPGDIKAIQLLRGIPHRIKDPTDATYGGSIGDQPSAAYAKFLNGNYQAASVDSELVLLWQDLELNQAAASMLSHSDNFIENPFYLSATSFDQEPRAQITNQKTLRIDSGLAWAQDPNAPTESRFTTGDLVLVARIDGRTPTDAIATITRARVITLYKSTAAVLLDEDTHSPQFDSGDYESTTASLSAHDWTVLHDTTNDFISGTEYSGPPIVLYSSYGVNHIPDLGQNSPDYLLAFAGKFQHGAAFASYESYNGRGLNGQGDIGFGNALDFFKVGGTVAFAHVWEPLTLAVIRYASFAPAWLEQGETLFEAAWKSHQALSWMNLVLGDGLAITHIAPSELSVSPTDPMAAENGDPAQFTIHRTGDCSANLTATISLQGSATEGIDYQPISKSIAFAPNETDHTISVTPIPDATPEPTESIILQLVESPDYAVALDHGSATAFLSDQPIDAWRILHFDTDANGPDALDSADPDDDDLPNLLEYALNLDPLTPDADAMPHANVTLDPESGHRFLTFTFRTTDEAADAPLSLESSVDLKRWAPEDWTSPSSHIELIDSTSELIGGRTTHTRTVRWKTPVDDPALPGPIFLHVRVDH